MSNADAHRDANTAFGPDGRVARGELDDEGSKLVRPGHLPPPEG